MVFGTLTVGALAVEDKQPQLQALSLVDVLAAEDEAQLQALSLVGALAAEAETQLQSLPFTDVPAGEWYFAAVQFVHTNGIMTGTSATTFAPYAPLTRAALATILWRMEGEPATAFRPVFTDVAAGQWYSNAVIWAFDNGIVTGTSPTTFAPNANITREQFATMMHRYAEFAGQDLTVPASFNLNQFTDRGNISTWAMTAMRWAVYNGLIGGVTNTTLVPGGSAIRAQAATILMRFIQGTDGPGPAPTLVGTWTLLGVRVFRFDANGGGVFWVDSYAVDIRWWTNNGALYICISPDLCGTSCPFPFRDYYQLSANGNQLALIDPEDPDFYIVLTRG